MQKRTVNRQQRWISRRAVGRTLSTLVALTVAVGGGGLAATSAVAVPDRQPRGLALTWNAGADDLVARWNAPGELGPMPESYAVHLDGNNAIGDPVVSESLDVAFTPGPKNVHFADQPTDLFYTVTVLLHDTTDGDGPADAAETPPFPLSVSDLTGLSTGTNMTVSWTPNNNDGYVDDYLVTLDGPGLAAPETAIADPTESSSTFSEIPIGDYTATVTARNSSGSGPSASATVTVDGRDVPGAPTDLVAKDTQDATVGITWLAPLSDGGTPVVHYLVQISFANDVGGNHSGSSYLPGDARSATFYPEPYDQGDYVITVIAENSSGQSLAASTNPQAMVHSTTPTSPQHVSATSPDPNTAVVSWTAPSSDGGQPVDEYDISLGDAQGFTEGHGRSFTFFGVSAGTYTANVTAQNSNGDSPTSTAQVTVADVVRPPVTPNPPVVTPVTPAPAVPTHPHAAHVKKGGVTTITWAAPKASAGAPVLRYLVVVDGRLAIVKAGHTSVTIKGLRAGPAKVVVRAVNKNGVSKPAVTKIHVAKSVAHAPEATLQSGMHGAAVRHLQIALGMRYHNGTFAKSTRAAVIGWQRGNGVHRTGVANDRMRFLLGV